jgi:hypothetical protein
MATPASIGDIYLAGLAEQYGDTPTLDPKLVAQHASLLKTYADLAKGLDATQAKRTIAQLAEQQKAFATITKARASVAETRASSSRVTAKNFQDAIEAAEKVDAALTLKANVTTPQYEASARAFERAGKGQAGAVAAAQALTSWFDDFTNAPLGPSHPNIDVIMNRTAEKLIGEPLTAASAPRLIAALGTGGSETVRDRWAELVNAGALRRDETMALQAQNRSELDSLKDASGKYARIAAGSPGALKIEADLQKLTEDLGPRLMKALGRDAADIAAEQELIVNENAQLEKIRREADRLGDIIYGGQKADPIARLVASPGFREWAEANSIQLGQASVDPTTGEINYVPGAQDSRAIALYKWQAEHPGRYSPLRRNKSTGAFVRVTFEDQAARERIVAKYRSTNDKFYMDAEGNLVAPSDAAETLEKGGYAPSVEMAKAGGKAYLRKADGTVLDAATGLPATAPADAKFAPALHYGADGSTRYLTADDVSTPDKVTALFSAPDGAATFGVLEPSDAEGLATHAKMAPLAARTEDQMRSTWTNTVAGYLDGKHAADYLDPNFGGDTISLSGGAIRIPGGVPATIEILETKDRFSFGDVMKGWRRRMDEAHMAKLEAQGVPQAEVPYLTGLAQQARAEFLREPPEAAAPPTTVKIPTTTAGGVETGITVPIGSPAARAAGALGKVAPAEARAKTYKTADGKQYRVDYVSNNVTLLNPQEGEKSSWTMDEITPELAATVSAGEIVNFEGPTGPVSAEAATPDAEPAAAQVTPPAPTAAAPAPKPAPPVFPETAVRPEAPEPRVTLVPPAAQAIVDRTTERKPIGQRIGAAAAELFVPGPPGERRRPIRDLVERLRGDRPDEGARAAEKAVTEEEKAAAKRTAERERGDAIGPVPTVREDVLTAAADVAGTKAAATPTRPQEGAASQALSRGVESAFGLPSAEEARKRGLDAQVMGFLMNKNVDPRVSDLAGRAQVLETRRIEADKARDLARRGLGQMPDFDATAYAAQVKALADEARERMRTPRGIEGTGALPVGGRVFGEGAEIESETPIVRLPGAETQLATSPFLARIVEARQAREAAPAPTTETAPPAPEPAAERPTPPLSPEMRKRVVGLPTYAQSEATRGFMADRPRPGKAIEEMVAAKPKPGPRLKTFTQLQEEARKEQEAGRNGRTGGM